MNIDERLQTAVRFVINGPIRRTCTLSADKTCGRIFKNSDNMDLQGIFLYFKALRHWLLSNNFASDVSKPSSLILR